MKMRYVPERLNDEDRAEYERLNKLLNLGVTAGATAIRGVAFVTGGILALNAAGGLFNQMAMSALIVLAGAAAAVLLLGYLIARGIDSAAIRTAERRQLELRQKAEKHPYYPPRPKPGRGDYDDGTDWKRYPVTGTYNPELYRARGGRATASGMAAWGIDDYETYRSNIE